VVHHGAVYFRATCILYDTYVKYRSARKRRQIFHDERVPSRQTIHNLVNELRTMGLLVHKKQKHMPRVLTEKLDDIGARIEHIPRKSLKRLAQETAVSKSTAGTATHLLKVTPHKATVFPCLAAMRCS
jgi:signal recognition particle subunit SEC65